MPESLTETEKAIIGECLRACAFGPFFTEDAGEHHTLLGITSEEMAGVANVWPQVDEQNLVTALAISNGMLQLVGYPHGYEKKLPQYLSVSRAEVLKVFEKWREGSIFGPVPRILTPSL